MGTDRELLDSFLTEARDYLADIRSQLAPALEGERLDSRRTRTLLDAVHSLKGVSGLLGFTHLHSLVGRLEQYFTTLALASPQATGIEPALANAAITTLERMISNIGTGQPERNADVLLDFELGAEIFSVVAARPETHEPPTPADLSAAGAEVAAAFAEEVTTLGEGLTEDLLEALDQARPAQRQAACARWLETMSGLVSTAQMAGRPDVSDHAGFLERWLRDVAEGRRPAEDETLDVGLRSVRALVRLASAALGDEEALAAAGRVRAEAEARMAALLEDETGVDDAEALEELREIFVEEAREHLEAAASALAALQSDRGDTDAVHRLFRATHTLKGSAGTVGMAEVMEQAHLLEDLFARVRDGVRPLDESTLEDARQGLREIRSLTGIELTVEAPAAEEGRERTTRSGPAVRVPLLRLDALLLQTGDLLAARARVTETAGQLTELARAMARHRRELSARLEEFTLRHSFTLPARGAQPAAGVEGRAVEGLGPLEFDVYDEVNVLAREVAEMDFHLSETLGALSRLADGLTREVEDLATVAGRLQDGLTQARFVPMSDLFNRFVHPARDWATDEGKEVEVLVDAEGAEVDRSVADAVADPLVHLVRNAVAHGIESPATRVAAGKPQRGRVWMRARQEGRDVVLEIEDDGAGLDANALRIAAIERGLMTREIADATPDAQIAEVIFTPGFSTRAAADSLAGRGVGLDAVASAVSRLGGVISVGAGEVGGACFSARIPATLAVLPMLSVTAAGQVFALPLAAVRETLLVDRREIVGSADRVRVHWRNEELRVVSLGELTRGRSPDAHGPRRIPAVVIGHADRNAALVVDHLMGRDEGLLKPLGPLLDPLPLYSSAVVGGDGRVRLVLDVSNLLALSLRTTQPSRRTVEATETGGPRRPRVLIVDDSLSVRTFVGRILRSAGLDVDVAADGVAALERLEAERFDLLLTDLEMPRLHGFELLGRVAAEPRWTMPRLVLTSRAGPEHRARALELGADEVLAKPVKRELLLERVRHWLERAGTHSRSR